jgi:acyl-coenzyme A thioesterase PaaI-like protein
MKRVVFDDEWGYLAILADSTGRCACWTHIRENAAVFHSMAAAGLATRGWSEGIRKRFKYVGVLR